MFVGQRDAEAVDFELRHVVGPGAVGERVGQAAAHPLVERPQFLVRVGIVEAEHRLGVRHRGEAKRDTTADALGR